jgi:hypothetical protein
MIFLEVPLLCVCSFVIDSKLHVSTVHPWKERVSCDVSLMNVTFQIADVGSCHEIYLFGSGFGIAIAFTQRKLVMKLKTKLLISDGALACRMQALSILVFVSTYLFSVDQEGDKKHRVLINTMLSFCGAISSSFAFSSFFDAKNRPNLVIPILIKLNFKHKLNAMSHLSLSYTCKSVSLPV